jgi:hypothetical protein
MIALYLKTMLYMEVQKIQVKSTPVMELTAKKAITQNNAAVKASFDDKKVSVVLGAANLLAVGSFIIACRYFNLDYLPAISVSMTISTAFIMGYIAVNPPENTEPSFVPDVAWDPRYQEIFNL